MLKTMIVTVICLILSALAQGEVLTSYSFRRNDCLTSSFANEGVLKDYTLRLPTNAHWKCPRSNGLLSANFALSSVDLRQVQDSLQNRSFSLELWLAPATRGIGSSVKIVNLGGNSTTDGTCNSGLLQLSQVRVADSSKFQFKIFACNSGFRSWSFLSPQYTLSKSIDGSANIVHLVVNVEFELIKLGSSLNYQTTAYYVLNGNTAAISSDSIRLTTAFDATTWDGSKALEIFPTVSSISSSSDIVLYYFGLRNETLSAYEIQKQLNNSISLSEPVTYSTNVTVLENGQINDESMNPAFFTRNVSNEELPIIALGLYNLNQDPISPNYPLGNGIKSQVYLTSLLPRAFGQLYFLNGSSFDDHPALEVPWDDNMSSYALRYRPPYNTYSIARPIVQVDFYAKDKLTNSTSSVSTLSIYVQRVIKPPVATPTVLTTVLLARKAYTIQLNGSPDVGQSIVSANITQLPLNGKLYSRRDDGLLHRLMSNETKQNMIYLRNGQINVIYMFTGNENVSEVVADYFSFLVQDNSGLFSIPANVTLSAITSLSAIDTVYHVLEDRLTAIQINGGRDQADIPRNLRAILRSQPILGGQVLNESSYTPYHVGETFAGVLQSGVSAFYQPPMNYFTTPNTTVNGDPIELPHDQFAIQISDDSMTAYSSWATQSIVIQNINDPTTILCDASLNANLTIQKYSDSSIQNSVLTLNNFTVVDPDLDTDRIRVSITSPNGGYISLAPDALSDIDFNSNTYCNENGRSICKGDGFSDNDMLFVCSPSGLSKALNGLTYFSTRSNVYDTINITIYDGESGACLNRTLLDPITIFNGCLTTNFQLQVYVQGPGAVDGTQKNSISQQFLSTNLKYLLLGLMVLILIILIRWCCAGRSRQRRSKRATKQDEKQSPAPTPERQKRQKQSETKALPTEAIEDDYDEEAMTNTKKSIPTALDQYPRMISLADITTPPRRSNNNITTPSSSSKSRAITEGKQPSVTDKSSKKNVSTTASSTPTKIDSLASKSSRSKKNHLSATTQELGIASSVSAFASAPTHKTTHHHVTAFDTVTLNGSLPTSAATVTRAATEVRKDEAVTACILWTAHRHSSGRTYYYNKRTKKSVWLKPEDFV